MLLLMLSLITSIALRMLIQTNLTNLRGAPLRCKHAGFPRLQHPISEATMSETPVLYRVEIGSLVKRFTRREITTRFGVDPRYVKPGATLRLPKGWTKPPKR